MRFYPVYYEFSQGKNNMNKTRNKWIKQNSEKLTKETYRDIIGTNLTQTIYDARDYEQIHGTYKFEMTMLDYIRAGNTEKMKQFLLDSVNRQDFNEGKLAENELRQAKNIFIGLVAMVGKMAAIPAGVPVEHAYFMIDTYTQQCETLNTIEEVYVLQYNMIIDFTSQVARYMFPSVLTADVQSCTNFIIQHLNEPLTARDVIDFSGKSRSALSEQFKRETGHTIGEYITKCKIDEAKTLLKYTDKTIAEICNYLAFSSQPYFHNVFKKSTSMTPVEYRNL